MASPAAYGIEYDAEADVGEVNLTDNLPAVCPACDNICAMLIERGDKGARVTCMGCLHWWVRWGEA